MNRFTNPLAPRRAIPDKTRQIKEWVRALHGLDDNVVVAVTELACRDVSCPDDETVNGIMRRGEKIATCQVH